MFAVKLFKNVYCFRKKYSYKISVWGVLRTTSAMVGPRFSVAFWNKLSQNGRKLLVILNKIILAFLEPCLLLSEKKNLLFQRIFLPLVLKCLKFNSFMLQSQKKNEAFSVIELPFLARGLGLG